MSLKIQTLRALEVLDSRGRPTLLVEASLTDGTTAAAYVPSGASTGRHEAVELRDGNTGRYAGRGVLNAVHNVNAEIANELQGKPAGEQQVIDDLLCRLDGTPNKERLGANALLGASCAVARAVAVSRRVPLYVSLGNGTPVLPVPMINMISGGLHAGGNIEFQDFLIIPHGFDTLAEALEASTRVHAMLEEILRRGKYTITGVADEGGWGPLLPSNEEALFLLTVAIAEAGYTPGLQISIAIDAAATHFYNDGKYRLHSEGVELTAEGMVERLASWCGRVPLLSIEDGLAEDDWSGWAALTRRLGGETQIVGDDLFTTNPERLERGIREKAANTVLVKMNQIGTLSETFNVCAKAKAAGFAAVVSARSGETEDSFLADLATALGTGQIKIGSITRSERLAKYNRLLELEAWHGLPYPGRRFTTEILGRNR